MIGKLASILCLLLFVISFNSLPAQADEVTCAAGEVKVCFLNGDCMCKTRTIEPSDTIPAAESECYDDPEDPENTICPWDGQEPPAE